MEPFNEDDTISAPTDGSLSIRRRYPIIALRIHGTGREIDLPLHKRRFTVGSHLRCDVVIDDPYVSNVHCIIERRDDGDMVLRDRKSKNGTELNGNNIELAELRPGALVTIGKTKLVLLSADRRGRPTAYEQLRGEDPSFRTAVDTAVRAASSQCGVLILGETGTGKELIARTIHEASPRSARPFVALNCGAIPRELIASQLFGHDKGAFTGAVSERDGVFTKADGGTLFLDELGELPRDQQPHLLRVLETGVICRVGSDREHPVDVRLVAATNRSDGLGTSTSSLRLDLFHRIATVVVSLPPLRDREGDIPILARAFMDELAAVFGRRSIDRSTMTALCHYSWPGNVRELRHAIERAMTLCPGELSIEALLPDIISATRAALTHEPHDTLRAKEHGGTLRYAPAPANGLRALDRLVRDAMLDALAKHGSIRRAAIALGMPKSTFADRARRFGIALGGKQSAR